MQIQLGCFTLVRMTNSGRFYVFIWTDYFWVQGESVIYKVFKSYFFWEYYFEWKLSQLDLVIPTEEESS